MSWQKVTPYANVVQQSRTSLLTLDVRNPNPHTCNLGLSGPRHSTSLGCLGGLSGGFTYLGLGLKSMWHTPLGLDVM
jgi:hypothetical protein